MTKVVLVVLLVVVGGVVGWLHWSPRHSIQQLRAAALEGDTTTLNRLVDFPRVRSQLRSDLGLESNSLAMFRPRPKRRDVDPKRFTAFLLVNGETGVNQLASPSGFSMLMLTGQPSLAGGTGAVTVRSGYEDYPDVFVATLHSAERAPEDTVNLVWHRRGLAWRMERLRIASISASNTAAD